MALADRLRPTDLDDIVGQEHITEKNKIIRNAIESGNFFNCVLYGPPGTGKTTFANILSKKSSKKLYTLNAVSCSSDDIRNVLSELDTFNGLNGIIFFIDELGYLNVRQQQLLLEKLEEPNSKLTLIGATTQNPYSMHKALLSRCLILEFKQLDKLSIIKGLERAIKYSETERNIQINYDKKSLEHITEVCEGDLRSAINFLEVIINGLSFGKDDVLEITIEKVLEISPLKVLDIDKSSKYDLISALQKSIRGSDVDASIHYLARLIKTGDLDLICRRLSCIACEDVFPLSINVVESCISGALRVGFPEAKLHLSNAVIYMCLMPKSHSGIKAIDKALSDIENGIIGDVPNHLKDNHYVASEKLGRGKGYKYPHDYPNNYVKQQYLPDELKDRQYYEYGNTKFERASKEYWDKIKK